MKKYLPETGITIILITLAILLSTISAISILVQPANTSIPGQPGGPRQIPGELLGCHYPNQAYNVNTNPHCLGLQPPIPNCQTIKTGPHDYPCRDAPVSPPGHNQNKTL